MPYLDYFPVIRTADHEAMRHALLTAFGATSLEFPAGMKSFHGHANHLRLSKIELAFCAYGSPVELTFPETGYTRIQIALQGISRTEACRTAAEVRQDQMCINPVGQAAKFFFGPNYQQLILRVSTEAIYQKLASYLGAKPKGEIGFHPVLDLGDPLGQHFRRLVLFSVNQLDESRGRLPALLVEEMQQKIVAALLCCAPHSFSELLKRSPEAAAPWQVRRVEEFVAENSDKPITIEMLSEITGASARSIFHAFQSSRGYSPMEFVKQMRLRRARKMLTEADTNTTVTGVAFACGFLNLGHFAKYYRGVFGEKPSETLRKRLGISGRPGN